LTSLDATSAVSVARCAGSAELPEGAFDILFSRFGVMFFDDPTGAFAHMRRALQPGGRVAFVCWRGAAENDWVRLPMGAIKGIVPPTVEARASPRKASAPLGAAPISPGFSYRGMWAHEGCPGTFEAWLVSKGVVSSGGPRH
jgi:SAM-dependent methyltransferase